MSPQGVNKDLQPLERSELPDSHPVAILAKVYEAVLQELFEQQLPAWEAVVSRMPSSVLDCSLVMIPVESDGYIDYEIIQKGARLPKVDPNEVAGWKYYSDSVGPEFLRERLLEFTSCTVLKKYRITKALSARSSSLNIHVYRGIFPMYFKDYAKAGIIIAVAPVYAEVSEPTVVA